MCELDNCPESHAQTSGTRLDCPLLKEWSKLDASYPIFHRGWRLHYLEVFVLRHRALEHNHVIVMWQCLLSCQFLWIRPRGNLDDVNLAGGWKVQEGVVDKHNTIDLCSQAKLDLLTETSRAYAHPTSSGHERIVAIKELRTPWRNLWPPPVFNFLPRRQWTASRSPDNSLRRSTTAKRYRRDWILRTGWTSSWETSTTARLASDMLGGP